MAGSPSGQTLYRRLTWVVILMAALGSVRLLRAQFVRAPGASKGPRALGLLQLLPSGRAHLVPICIMVDGKFYDASIYKATPVPMALEPDTVYEGERTGVPAGLFTVTQAAQTNGNWLGNGTWLETGAQPPSTGRKAEAKPREEEEDKPPVLRRPGPESPPAQSKPEQPPSSPASQPAPSTPKPPVESAPSSSGQTVTSATSAPAQPEDSGRPRLRRGVPEQHAPAQKEAAPSAEHVAPARPGASTEVRQMPAISDAGGPDPRPYTYEMKPREEREFRRKMLELASAEVLKWSRKQSATIVGPTATSPKAKSVASAVQPQFENVNLTVFDLFTNNEPILVLSAGVHVSASRAKSDSAAPGYYITLVARADLYGELRTIFSGVTDENHLDLSPRMQLIDAVDADGDGRGELLFRQLSDAGTAYAVYRVTPDRLVPLFEGSPPGQ
jgi:hypothetical protein